MRIAVAINERSGRGRGVARASALEHALTARGHAVTRLAVTRLASLLEDPPEVLVLVGGDGTVSHSLGLLADLKVPIWHCPAGTENLFARTFGSNVSAREAAEAIGRARVRHIDLGVADIEPGIRRRFALMVSVGPDAAVVDAVDQARTDRITHLSYVLPSIRAMLGGPVAPLSVEIDGSRLISDTPGMAVVSNIRAYGARLDWLAGAQPDDGLLDVAFLPGRTPRRLIPWALRAWLRRPLDRSGALVTRARAVAITSAGEPVAMQADGEPLGVRNRIALSIEPGALAVIDGRS